MAAVTIKKYTSLKLTAANGSTQTIELPEANSALTGADSVAAFEAAIDSIAPVFQTDDGYGLASAALSMHTLTTADDTFNYTLSSE